MDDNTLYAKVWGYIFVCAITLTISLTTYYIVDRIEIGHVAITGTTIVTPTR